MNKSRERRRRRSGKGGQEWKTAAIAFACRWLIQPIVGNGRASILSRQPPRTTSTPHLNGRAQTHGTRGRFAARTRREPPLRLRQPPDQSGCTASAIGRRPRHRDMCHQSTIRHDRQCGSYKLHLTSYISMRATQSRADARVAHCRSMQACMYTDRQWSGTGM